MATMLEDIVAYLDNGMSLTAGTNLFAGAMPDAAPASSLLVSEYPGEGPVHTFGPDDDPPDFVRPRIQVLARGEEYIETLTVAMAAHALLQSVSDRTLSGTLYTRIEAIQSQPFFLGLDKNQRFQIACNYQVWKAP